MIKEILEAFAMPFKMLWSILDNDAHRIVSKRGQEILESKREYHTIKDMRLIESKDDKTYTIMGEKVRLVSYYYGICYYFIKVGKEHSMHGRYAKELNLLREGGRSDFPEVAEKESYPIHDYARCQGS